MFINEEIVEKARRCIGENEKRRNETVQIIRRWIEQQPHFSSVPTGEIFFFFNSTLIHFDLSHWFDTDDAFILFFTRGCKYRLEKIKRKIDTYLSMRTALPEFFSGWNPFKPELQAALGAG